MKTIEEKVEIPEKIVPAHVVSKFTYVAEDGTEFNSENECEWYEKRLKSIARDRRLAELAHVGCEETDRKGVSLDYEEFYFVETQQDIEDLMYRYRISKKPEYKRGWYVITTVNIGVPDVLDSSWEPETVWYMVPLEEFKNTFSKLMNFLENTKR